jgi:hypothetical protein
MREMLRAFLLLAAVSAAPAHELKTAATHPIQYYVSLPQGWTAARRWPVAIVIESANREFAATLDVFIKARGAMPFILAAPLVTTNGGAGYRQVPTYRYSDPVWARIERDRCGFDMDGIAAVADDMRTLYSGEDKYFLTGWEAGGHTVWAMLLRHPERIRAAAPAVTNFAGRCMEGGFSGSPSRAELPVNVFQVSAGRDVPPGKFVYSQSQEAQRAAKEHGFAHVTETLVDGQHGPLAEQVLSYFHSLMGR